VSVIIVGWGTGGASPHGLVIESASLAAGDDGADLRGEPRRCRAEPAGALARDRPARRRRNAGTPLARAVAVKLSLTAGYAVDARVEAGGDERAPQGVRTDLPGQSRPAGDLPDDPPTPCLSSRCTVRVMKIGPPQRLAMARSGAGAPSRAGSPRAYLRATGRAATSLRPARSRGNVQPRTTRRTRTAGDCPSDSSSTAYL